MERNIINFFELEEQWQKEAISNLEDMAEEALYLEPEPGQNPKKHVLWDLTECMPHAGIHEGFEYNAIITISNNSAMLLKIDSAGETAITKIV